MKTSKCYDQIKNFSNVEIMDHKLLPLTQGMQHLIRWIIKTRLLMRYL